MNVLLLYEILFCLGSIISLPFWLIQLALFPKRRNTFLQRLSLQSLPERFSQSKPVWIHALSVGEVLSAAPFVKRFAQQFPNRPVVFSASTQTGFETANQHIALHPSPFTLHPFIFFPYDIVFSVRKMIDAVNPSLAIIVETDIWPGFLYEMKKRQIPVMLVNARLSDRSFKGYRRIRFFSKHVFSLFTKICAQTDSDKRRFLQLGVSPDAVMTSGNFKFDQDAEPISEAEIRQLRRFFRVGDGAKIIVAGSTHPGEEWLLLQVFSKLQSEYPDICLMIAPRNPERSASVSRIFSSAGYHVRLYSDLKQMTPETHSQIIVIDALGLLKKLYALSDIAFVGGSLVDFRGHNPLEPALAAKPVLFGPFMSDFRYIADELVKAGGAVQVQNSNELCHAITSLLKNEDKAKKIGINALEMLNRNKGAIDKTLNEIKQYILQ